MVNWQEIDTVLLDMDGTLLDLYFDNYFWRQHLPKKYAAHHNCDLNEAITTLEDLSTSLKGSLNWYCVDHWSEQLQMDIEALKHEVSHLIQLRPDCVGFLNYLKANNKTAVLVTNAHPRILNLKVQASGLDKHLGQMISSHNFNLAKENKGFWERLQEREGLDYSRCLFIDDSLPVLQRARNEGLQHTLQILQPDMSAPPLSLSDFPGIVDFAEIMT